MLALAFPNKDTMARESAENTKPVTEERREKEDRRSSLDVGLMNAVSSDF